MKKIISIVILCVTLLLYGTALVACGGDNVGGGHTHTFSSEWSSDESYHWHEATCEHTSEVSDRGEHTWSELIVDTPSTETTKGTGHKECTVCGKRGDSVTLDYSDGIDFDPEEDVTLLFDTRGGSETASVTVKAGTVIKLSDYATENDGFVFSGWEIGGVEMSAFVIKKDTIAHAVYTSDKYTGKSFKLGKYPQTVVSEQEIIDGLNALTAPQENGYYLLGGVEYARVVCTSAIDNLNKTSNDGKVTFEVGKTYWFRVEPIEWVYDSGRYTASKVLDVMGFNDYDLNSSDFGDWRKLQPGYTVTPRDNDYALSTVRYFLNELFYKNNLTEAEQALLSDTIINSFCEDSTYGDYTYENVTDKIFLWDRDEYFENHETPDSKSISASDYAIARGSGRKIEGDISSVDFWFYNPDGEANVKISDTSKSGIFYNTDCGILPCLNIRRAENRNNGDPVHISFNSNGGSEISSLTILANKLYDLDSLCIPTKENFLFAGWYSDESLNKPVGKSSFGVDKTLYAKWVPEVYSISYELGGGYFRDNDGQPTEYTPIEAVTFINPRRDSTNSYNYEFDGWFLDASFTERVTSTEGLRGDIVLYAHWIENGVYFDIEYRGIDDAVMPDEYPTKFLFYGSDVTLPTPVKEGYVFLGWETKDEYNAYIRITTLNAKKFNSKVTLTAVFEKAYKVTVDLDGGTLENLGELPETVYYRHDSIDFSQFTPEKDGYVFLYWLVNDVRYAGKVTTKTLVFNSQRDMRDLEIKAVFSKIKRFTVNPMGGSMENTVVEIYEWDGLTFVSPVKEGCKILGYSFDLPGRESMISGITIRESLTQMGTYLYNHIRDDGTDVLYTVWDKVTISFETNAEGVTVDSCTGSFKEDYRLPTPTREGYKFVGWHAYEDLSDSVNTTWYLAYDRTLYAEWVELCTITVLDGKDGNTVGSFTVAPGDKLSRAMLEEYLNLPEDKYTVDWKTSDGDWVSKYYLDGVTGSMTVYPYEILTKTKVTVHYSDGQADKIIYLKTTDKLVISDIDKGVSAVDGKFHYGWYLVNPKTGEEAEIKLDELSGSEINSWYGSEITIYTKWYDNISIAGNYYGFLFYDRNLKTGYDYSRYTDAKKMTLTADGWISGNVKSARAIEFDAESGKLTLLGTNNRYIQYVKCGGYEFLLVAVNSNSKIQSEIPTSDWNVYIFVKGDSAPASMTATPYYGEKKADLTIGGKTFNISFITCTAEEAGTKKIFTVTES